MKKNTTWVRDRVKTLMLDMDGTLLDLAFDNHVWVDLVPRRYAERHNTSLHDARQKVREQLQAARGELRWYCLDHWSNTFDFDILQLHHDVSHRIGYLPGAVRFLRAAKAADLKVLLVTNSHADTLELKDAVTGVCDFVDAVHTSHQYGHAKEAQAFWHELQAAVDFEPETTLFIDDSVSVLESARLFGIGELLQVTEPDTTAQSSPANQFTGVRRVAELLDS